MGDKQAVLEMKSISKHFPGVKALSNVNFRLLPGEVHALMGQNGAGKSTLIKVLTGYYKSDAGKIILEGNQIHPSSPLEAQQMGISAVYQEVNLCPNLSVAENIFIGRQPMKMGRIDWKTLNRSAREVLKKLNLAIDVTRVLASYSVAIQQMIAIARALDISAKILILDEPTSSLDENEVNLLFNVLKTLKAEGMAVLFVTHFIDQMYRIADRVTVLKNGEWIGEYETEKLSKLELIARMLGKELTEFSQEEHRRAAAADSKANAIGAGIRLKALGVGRRGSVLPFDLELKSGEVLGVAGLLGSGRTEMARLLFGIDRTDYGEFTVNAKKVTINAPSRAINLGIGFCPEDRKAEGIVDELSVRENIILALQGKLGIARFLNRKKQEEIAEKFIKALRIVTPSAGQSVKNLSGGNQQKVILARWLATNPQLLILDEPTRGIDVGAKVEIMEAILKLAEEGKGILFISSELEEVIRCSNRVAVLKDRIKIGEVTGNDINEDKIMKTIAGGGEDNA